MPWFTILGNYSTTLSVPKGIANTTIPFSDIAGVGRPGPGNTGILYNLDSGTIVSTPGRSISLEYSFKTIILLSDTKYSI